MCHPAHSVQSPTLLDGNPTDAFYMDTLLPDPPAQGRAAAVTAHSRARHTRERAAVEKMIMRQLKE